MQSHTHIRVLDRRVVPKGELLFAQGELGNRAYFIEKGKVEVFRQDARGHHVVLAEIGPGSIVGEMAILNDDFRTASVRVTEDAVLVGISAADLKKSLANTDDIFRALMQIMAERIKKSNEQICRQQVIMQEMEKALQARPDAR